MPKPRDGGKREFKKYLEQEYDRLWKDEMRKPPKKRRSKKEVSKQAYAIAMSVMRRQKERGFKEETMPGPDTQHMPASVVIDDYPDVDLDDLEDSGNEDGYDPDLDFGHEVI